MAHSKRNTSLAFFTAHERDELKSTWGSRSTRLNHDSFLPFGSCRLCLLPARDAVSCPSKGHLFCRECAVSNLLAQSKELKRLKKEAERRKLEEEQEKELEDVAARGEALEDFERVQAGLSAQHKQNGRERAYIDPGSQSKGTKRKLEDDGTSAATLADEARKGKRRASDQNGGNGEASFWVPSKTPDNKKMEVKTAKQHPTCPAAEHDQPHEFSLKTLVSVQFSTDQVTRGSESATRTCPSCNKVLSNTTKAVLAKPCGHVLCKPCSDKFQKAAERSAHDTKHDETVRCYVCEEDITPGRKARRKESDNGDSKDSGTKVDRGVVELSTEGTGFAGGGKNMVTKQGLAFQC